MTVLVRKLWELRRKVREHAEEVRGYEKVIEARGKEIEKLDRLVRYAIENTDDPIKGALQDGLRRMKRL